MATMVTRVGKDAVIIRVRKDGRVTTATSRLDIEPTTAYEPVIGAIMWTLAALVWQVTE